MFWLPNCRRKTTSGWKILNKCLVSLAGLICVVFHCCSLNIDASSIWVAGSSFALHFEPSKEAASFLPLLFLFITQSGRSLFYGLAIRSGKFSELESSKFIKALGVTAGFNKRGRYLKWDLRRIFTCILCIR